MNTGFPGAAMLGLILRLEIHVKYAYMATTWFIIFIS